MFEWEFEFAQRSMNNTEIILFHKIISNYKSNKFITGEETNKNLAQHLKFKPDIKLNLCKLQMMFTKFFSNGLKISHCLTVL